MEQFGQIEEGQTQTGSDHPVQATVGVPFTVFIPNAGIKDDPGSSWFNGYDSSFLSIDRSGWQITYEGTSATWAQFTPSKAGTTVIEGYQQPYLINPLFIQYNFTVTISS